MPLQYEIKTSHMLGIIVAAEEDDELKSEIIRQLKILYPNYFEYLQHPNEKSARNMTREQNQMRHMQPYSSLYGAYFLNFLYDSPEKNATFNSDPDLKRQYQRQLEIIYMRKWVVTPMELEENRAALIDKDLKRILNSWQSIDHFTRFVKCIEEYSGEMGWDIPLSSALQNHKDMVLSYIRIRMLDYDLMLYSNYTEKPENNAAITKLEDVYLTLAHLCKWAGYNLDETNRSELKKQEQNDLIQLSKVYKGNRQNRFSIEKYVYNLFIFRLLQEYKKAKKLYFQDNEEYRLLEEKQKQTEILALQNQLQELTQKNNRLIEENQSLQEENQRLRALLLKTEQETQKNYKQQISDMDQQIKDQQQKLYDLVPLREFIFSLENIEYFSENSISLQDYSKAARIAVLGGHENLRKKK